MNAKPNRQADEDLNFDDALSDIGANERRKVAREPRKEVKGKLYYQLKIDQLGKQIFETSIGRLAFALALFATVFLLVWELGFRVEVINNNLNQNSENSRLLIKLENLQTQWSEDELKEIEQSIKKAESKIFSSVPRLADWINEKKIEVTKKGFNFKYSIGSAIQVELDGTYSMPVKFMLSANEYDGYNKTLAFIKHIIEENRRIEIAAIDAKSGKKGLNSFSILMNVWVKDPNGIVESSKNTGEDDNVEFIQ